jgi:transcriptional antiterminator NusG
MLMVESEPKDRLEPEGVSTADEETPAIASAVDSEAGEAPVAESEAAPGDMPETETVEAAEAADEVEEVAGDLEADLPETEAPEEEPAAEAVLTAAPEAGSKAAAGEEEAARPAEEPDDGRRWYVVHCYSGYENKVRHNLEQRIETMGMKDRIFDVVVPTEEEIEVKDGKRRTIERRVFPGYILVQMILSEESWYVVRNTPGVTGFVGMGNEPTPLRPEEVAQIIKRMEAEAPRVKVTYKAGQKVRIIDGPFNDFIGTVDEIDMERAKVRVMVSFFGRETPVELDFLQVEKA